MNKETWRHLLHRDKELNKYDLGHVLVIGGSAEMAGAPVLAARAVLRVGVGLVTIASTAETVELVDRDIEEVMTLPLPDWAADECVAKINAFVDERHVSGLVVGPGLPKRADKVIRTLLVDARLPMVLDGEAFSALSRHLDVLKAATAMNKSIILTPHPGEYARLNTLFKPGEADERRVIAAFAKEYQLTLVLKHSHTLVANAAGELYENTTGNPGLATAGAGDVLSGVVAGLLAQGIEPYDAACMGTYLHGLAGDVAAHAKTEPGMIASDIIEALPLALRQLDN